MASSPWLFDSADMRGRVSTIFVQASLLCVWLARPGQCQFQTVPESPAVAEVARAVAAGRETVVAQFWKKVKSDNAPLIEAIPGDSGHVLATFLWQGDPSVNDVVLVAQPDGVAAFRDPRSHLVNLAGTDIWYRTHRLPASAEFSYLFSVNPARARSSADTVRTFRADPLNSLQYRILTGPVRSIARMPAVEPNPWIEEHRVPAGDFLERSITSRRLKTGALRRLWVYRSPGDSRNPNLLILLDGTTYAKALPTARMLDNLYADGRIGSTIAVLVADGEQWQKDLDFSDDFVAFLAEELVPWVQREYGFTASPARTAIGGESIAGLTAAYAAFRRPDLFTKVLAQSASFWLNNHDADGGEPEWFSRQILRAPTSAVSFWIDVGRMEFVANEADRAFPPFVPGMTSLLAANRHVRDVLRAKCYSVTYSETDGGHEPLRWARTLPRGLMALLGVGESLAARSSERESVAPACAVPSRE
jgi:enterochelin esterase-like enzyme